MSVHMEHINLRVPSIPRTQQFLGAAFPDFRQRGQGFSETYGYWTHFGNEETYLALLQADKPGTETTGPIKDFDYHDPYRLMHVGLVIDDIPAMIERLAIAGFTPDSDDCEHPHRRRVYYLDGNGIEWEFIQYLSDVPEERNDYSL
jgi:catechol 2,3-dioxygenase-like lactoylglutathione lyase family enzyme